MGSPDASLRRRVGALLLSMYLYMTQTKKKRPLRGGLRGDA
jgi:hypothetical protein